jgi:hypothetical protein
LTELLRIRTRLLRQAIEAKGQELLTLHYGRLLVDSRCNNEPHDGKPSY